MSERSGASRRTFVKSAAILATSSWLSGPEMVFAEQSRQLAEGEAWLNEPKQWRREGSTIICTANPKTDFWRKTFYGYITDNGHLLYRRVKGDFSTTVKLIGQYRDLYDQAGLMVRSDEKNWMKCGVEMVERKRYLSVVFTRDFSDWSTALLPDPIGPVWMRVDRKGDSLDVFHSLNGKDFVECRMGYFAPSDYVMVGPMCAAPEGKGFEAQFQDWKIETKS